MTVFWIDKITVSCVNRFVGLFLHLRTNYLFCKKNEPKDVLTRVPIERF